MKVEVKSQHFVNIRRQHDCVVNGMKPFNVILVKKKNNFSCKVYPGMCKIFVIRV